MIKNKQGSSPCGRSYRRRTSQPSGIASHSRTKKRRTSSFDYNGDLEGPAATRHGRGGPTERTTPRQPDQQRQVEERRVIYVGGIAEGTLKAELRQRFELFGPILDISLHFRERGSNYGFVTFQYQADAYVAVEHGNDDPGQQRYELSFGGRRAFCKEKYFDLDDVEASGGEGANAGFDELLRRARGRN